MGESLSPSQPKIAAAAQAASVRASIFFDMPILLRVFSIRVLGSACRAKFRSEARGHILLPAAGFPPEREGRCALSPGGPALPERPAPAVAARCAPFLGFRRIPASRCA